jgi:2-(1,2-epoxy-1,2-dihydrophenyl)acetyl-CoA isomerase
VSYELLTLERDGYVATITLNRPERLNALSRELTQELHHALDEVSAEFPQIRCVILTGNGRGFCSGADVGAMAARQQNGEPERRPWDPFDSIPPLAPHLRAIQQPVIAAVNGLATGAGLSLTLASDIRIASTEARFASIFVKRGLVPDTGSSVSLPDLIGLGAAAEMAYTGRLMDAQWALEKGLVNKVVPHDQLLHAARELADEIAANPPLAVRAAKQLLFRRQRLEDALPHEHDANAASMPSDDRIEAVRAFLEKRTPVFHGR